MKVDKTIKLYIGGKFPRTESLRSFKVYCHDSKEVYTNVCLASRKDFRMAVEAAKAGLSEWSGRAAYNRAHILYRMAEMCEGKRAEFVDIFKKTLGLSDKAANGQVDRAVDAMVYYSGFCDKFQQVAGSINPVSGPYSNATGPDPMGVVALIPEARFDFGRLAAHFCAIITGANSTIIILDKKGCPAVLSCLAEVFATCDLPGGVVNLLSADTAEFIKVVAAHMDVRAISFQNEDSKMLHLVKDLAVENLKRVIRPRKDVLNLRAILDTVEFKTVWQPIGF